MPSSRSKPPPTRIEDLVETIHGVPIADPYRWLEDGEARDVRNWVDAQNAFTRTCLDDRPGRLQLKRRLSRLLSIGVIGPPACRNGRYFHMRREGIDQNQPILYVREGAGGADRILIDLNQGDDGTSAIDWWFPSDDGRLVAYGVSSHGDEKSTLRIIEVDSGRHLKESIPHTRYCSMAWPLRKTKDPPRG